MLRMRLPIQFFLLRRTSYPRAKASSGLWQKKPESLMTCCAIQGKMMRTKNRKWISSVFNLPMKTNSVKLHERPASKINLIGGRLCLDFVNSMGARRTGPAGEMVIRDEKLNDYF